MTPASHDLPHSQPIALALAHYPLSAQTSRLIPVPDSSA
jgi:hypothetical protein